MPRVQQLLEELSNSFGPSGFEGPVREIVKREMLPLVDTVETDGIGSLIGRRGSRTDTQESCWRGTWMKSG